MKNQPRQSLPKFLSLLQWEVLGSIAFTLGALGIALFITIKLLLRSGDSVDFAALVLFSIFNLLETFLSLKLILEKIRKEYLNALRFSALEGSLILRGVIPKNWLDELNPVYKNLIDNEDD
jgi:hypothetical protein